MDFSCPACQHPLDPHHLQALDGESGEGEMSDGEDITYASCPKCGTGLFGTGETLTFRRSLRQEETSTIAHFELVRQLGRGGFGTVWLAEDLNLGRQVALKLPATGEGMTANLPHEAKTAAKLKHPNIVSVYEIGTDGDQPYIASEFIDGLNLQDVLSIKKPTVARAVEVMLAVADALQHAHANGVVHRDIKPANILVNAEGLPFVTDFGIAKQVSAEATISSDGQIVGTLRYMSPEQAAGKTQETDRRSDIYAMGVILFEMVTGSRPFQGNARALLHQKLNDDAPTPRKFDPAVPRDIETICLKCLEREPAKRYQSSGELAAELQRFAAGQPILARPVSTGEKLWRWCRRRPAVAGLLATTFFSLSLGLIGVSFFGLQAQRSGERARQSLYRSQMNLAKEYWQRGDVAALRRTIAPYATDDRGPRERGFEWYYYQHLLAPFQREVNHGDVVTEVAMSQDGRMFASTGLDRCIRVWDARSGEQIRTLQLSAGSFLAICFSPSNGQLASGSSDGMIRLWEPLSHDRPIREIKHGPAVHHLRYATDGRVLAAAGNAGAVRLWDVSNGELQVAFPSGAFGATCLRFSPNNELLAVATKEGRVRLWDTASETALHILGPNPDVENVAFTNDGDQIVAGGVGGTLRFWSVASGELLATCQTGAGIVGDLEVIKNSDQLAVLGVNGKTMLIDLPTQRLVKSVSTHTLNAGMIAQSAQGRRLVIGSGDGSVKTIDVETLLEPNILWHDSHVRDAAFLPSGKLVTAAGNGAVSVWDPASGTQTVVVPPDDRELFAVSVQAHREFVTSFGASRMLTMYDVESKEVVQQFEVGQQRATAAAFAASGRQLAVANRVGEVTVYRDADGESPFFPNHKLFATAPRDAEARALSFSRDESLLAVAFDDMRVSLLDTQTGTLAFPAIQLTSAPLSLTFCQSDQVLAIGTQAGEIKLWRRDTQSVGGFIKAHSSRVNALDALPDGTTLVSGGRDKELRLWDLNSGELLTSLIGHGRQIFCITVAADGETIVSGDLAGDLRIWRGPR